MSDQKELEDRVKQLAEQFRLKAHLAGMEAKTLWEEEVHPFLQRMEHKVDEATRDVDINEELSSIEKKLQKMVDDLFD